MERVIAELKNYIPTFDVQLPTTTGFYAFYINNNSFENTTLSGIKEYDCIYIGIAKDETLSKRIHKAHFKDSGKSTFRRSIGAILLNQLELEPTMRGINPTKSNISNFKFNDISEERISHFIFNNLSIAICSCENTRFNLRETEKILIQRFNYPAFNLEHANNQNEYYHAIKDARKSCRNRIIHNLE